MAVLEFDVDPEPLIDSRLGRHVHFDAKSANFQLRTLITADNLTNIETTEWRCDYFLNQGQEGSCVGFSTAHEIGAIPVPVFVDFAIGRRIYKLAQEKYDPWPGEAYEGTSVLAGMLAAQELGYIGEFRWAGVGSGRPLEDLVLALCNLGPGVFGIPWYQGMMNIDNNGFIWPSGNQVGGHAICAIGIVINWISGSSIRNFDNVDLDRSYIILHNSWGQGWGRQGRCYITLRNIDKLISEWGEFAIPMVRLDPNPQPEPEPPVPGPVYQYFSVKRSNIFHDIHNIRGVVEHRFVTVQEAQAAGKVACKTCKPR